MFDSLLQKTTGVTRENFNCDHRFFPSTNINFLRVESVLIQNCFPPVHFRDDTKSTLTQMVPG